ncbi:hypothetical protein EOS_27850 [Caballeronia mineralivorans PML1(12)]|uniref:Uncharacterized protein n=2 Tax=Caballeronia mineralivorans TaxID=2010198 RepID=A0A0J1CRN0_9BURK|nr:hypothetical protein EOS_27850 [Caballeronia mineralivorans PML1(12)]
MLHAPLDKIWHKLGAANLFLVGEISKTALTEIGNIPPINGFPASKMQRRIPYYYNDRRSILVESIQYPPAQISFNRVSAAPMNSQ